MISGFRSDVDDICAFLGCYAGCGFKSFRTFHGRHRQGGQEIQKEGHSLAILVISFFGGGILDHLKMILNGCPEMLVKIYHYNLRNNPEERSCRSEICFLKIVRFEWYVWYLKIFAAVDKTDVLKKACSYTYLIQRASPS